MPKDTTGVQGETRAPLISQILDVLRRHYYDDYHLEYVRLLSLGTAPRDFPARLSEAGFGSHCQEAVDFHLQRFYKRLPKVRTHASPAVPLTEAYKIFIKEPRQIPPKPEPTIDPTWVPSPAHVHYAGALGEGVDRSKWSLRPRREKSPDASDDPNGVEVIPRKAPRASSSENISSSLESYGSPSDSELVNRIRDLSPTKHRQLRVLVTFKGPPTQKEISTPYGLPPPSAAAALSGIYVQLGLAVPKELPSSRRREWSRYRHQRLRTVCDIHHIFPSQNAPPSR